MKVHGNASIAPKDVWYWNNGTGRDTYIAHDNGGHAKASSLNRN